MGRAELYGCAAGSLVATALGSAFLSAALYSTDPQIGSGFPAAIWAAICGAAAGFFIVKTIRSLR